MSIGRFISKFLPSSMPNILGAIIIILLGAYFLIQSILKLIKNSKANDLALKNITDMIDSAEKSDLDNSNNINIKEAFIVSLGLTFNNLATGLAASITGITIPITVISTFIFSIILIYLMLISHNS